MYVTLLKGFPFRSARRDLAFVTLHAGIDARVVLVAQGGGIQFGRAIHLLHALDTVLTNNFLLFRSVRLCLHSRSNTLIFRRGGPHFYQQLLVAFVVPVAPHFWNLESRNKRFLAGDSIAEEEFRHQKTVRQMPTQPQPRRRRFSGSAHAQTSTKVITLSPFTPLSTTFL
jgi:hypothetical protein